MKILWTILVTAFMLPVHAVSPANQTQVIEGEIAAADHQTYRAVPFDVPPGTQRLRIDFQHDGAEVRTVVDLGLHGPAGFRGASGSNKSSIEIGASDATPSYLPGPIEPGRWRLILSFPNVRAHPSPAGPSKPTTRFRVTVTLTPQGAAIRQSAFLDGPIRTGSAWYRGDLHSHSAHSDGSCAAASGRRVPCPVFVTVNAARQGGLDFIALTDHNSSAHFNALRELQPYVDDLLLIPGIEVTTFHGHANIFGAEQLDEAFFAPGGGEAALDAMFSRVGAQGGLVAVNHPGLPSVEECMGCGWSAKVDWSGVQALEIVNGGSLHQFQSAEGPFSAVRFWDSLLKQGRHITAIASSDSHDPLAPATRQVAVGTPRTVVHADELSQRALFAALRAGRAFVDVEGTSSRVIDLRGRVGSQEVQMGGTLHAAAGTSLQLEVLTQGVGGLQVQLVQGAGERMDLGAIGPTGTISIRLAVPAGIDHDFVRAEVRDSAGKLLLLSNPIYLQP